MSKKLVSRKTSSFRILHTVFLYCIVSGETNFFDIFRWGKLFWTYFGKKGEIIQGGDILWVKILIKEIRYKKELILLEFHGKKQLICLFLGSAFWFRPIFKKWTKSPSPKSCHGNKNFNEPISLISILKMRNKNWKYLSRFSRLYLIT